MRISVLRSDHVLCSGKRNWDLLTALSLFLPDLEMAVAYWNLVLSGRFKFLDLWNTFLLVSVLLLLALCAQWEGASSLRGCLCYVAKVFCTVPTWPLSHAERHGHGALGRAVPRPMSEAAQGATHRTRRLGFQMPCRPGPSSLHHLLWGTQTN